MRPNRRPATNTAVANKRQAKDVKQVTCGSEENDASGHEQHSAHDHL
jgi:hypothetical protein